MPIGTLTWNLVGPKHFVSGTNVGRAPKKNQVMATFLDLIKSSSYWDVASLDITGSNYEAIVVQPVATSYTPHIRGIITMNATGSISQWQVRTATTAETDEAGHLQIGFTPNITQGSGSYNNGNFLSDNPFGSDTRWSKYWSAGRVLTSIGGVEQCFLIESSESLFVGVKGRKNNFYGCLFGSIIKSLSSGSGEKNKRIYGMATTGNTTIATAIWAGTGIFNHSTVSHSNHFGTFIVSGSSANGPGAHQWQLTENMHVISTAPAGMTDGNPGNTITIEDTLVPLPIYTKRTEATETSIGVMRQVCMIQAFPSLVPIVTESLGVVGYTLGNDAFAANQALMFINKKI